MTSRWQIYAWVVGLLLVFSPAWADHIEERVTYACSPTQLVITRAAAFNAAGDALVAHLGPNAWSGPSLFDGAEGPPRTIHRTCRLAGHPLRVEISGRTWDRYHTEDSAHVRVQDGARVLIDIDLDPSPWSTSPQAHAVHRITVRGSKVTIF